MIKSHFLHSFIGHPIMAVMHLCGANGWGDWFHDSVFVEP